MSKKQLENNAEVAVKFKLDASSHASAQKLKIQSFRDAISKEAQFLLAHKLRSSAKSL